MRITNIVVPPTSVKRRAPFTVTHLPITMASVLASTCWRRKLGKTSEVFQAHRDLLIKDQLIIVEGEVSIDNFTNNYRIITQSIYDLAQARNRFAEKLMIKMYAGENFS